jgi:phosphoglycerate dehydrogenase-like enzyme
VPDLSDVQLVVPLQPVRAALVELMARPPGRLQVIQTLSAGVDWLVGKVPAHVTVCNARGVYDAPLAEWVVGAILAMQRGHIQARNQQARAAWDFFEPDELAGRRVVILGLGSIGSAIAERLRPFGVEIVGVGRTARDGVRALDDLDDLLPTAEILVSMLPHTTQTRGLLDARRLALLPDGALFVNAGRGKVVVTDALVSELRAGRLRAALDVVDPEPLPADHPLVRLDTCLVVPHVASATHATRGRMAEMAADNLLAGLRGDPLPTPVNPEVATMRPPWTPSRT